MDAVSHIGARGPGGDPDAGSLAKLAAVLPDHLTPNTRKRIVAFFDKASAAAELVHEACDRFRKEEATHRDFYGFVGDAQDLHIIRRSVFNAQYHLVDVDAESGEARPLRGADLVRAYIDADSADRQRLDRLENAGVHVHRLMKEVDARTDAHILGVRLFLGALRRFSAASSNYVSTLRAALHVPDLFPDAQTLESNLSTIIVILDGKRGIEAFAGPRRFERAGASADRVIPSGASRRLKELAKDQPTTAPESDAPGASPFEHTLNAVERFMADMRELHTGLLRAYPESSAAAPAPKRPAEPTPGEIVSSAMQALGGLRNDVDSAQSQFLKGCAELEARVKDRIPVDTASPAMTESMLDAAERLQLSPERVERLARLGADPASLEEQTRILLTRLQRLPDSQGLLAAFPLLVALYPHQRAELDTAVDTFDQALQRSSAALLPIAETVRRIPRAAFDKALAEGAFAAADSSVMRDLYQGDCAALLRPWPEPAGDPVPESAPVSTHTEPPIAEPLHAAEADPEVRVTAAPAAAAEDLREVLRYFFADEAAIADLAGRLDHTTVCHRLEIIEQRLCIANPAVALDADEFQALVNAAPYLLNGSSEAFGVNLRSLAEIFARRPFLQSAAIRERFSPWTNADAFATPEDLRQLRFMLDKCARVQQIQDGLVKSGFTPFESRALLSACLYGMCNQTGSYYIGDNLLNGEQWHRAIAEQTCRALSGRPGFEEIKFRRELDDVLNRAQTIFLQRGGVRFSNSPSAGRPEAIEALRLLVFELQNVKRLSFCPIPFPTE